MPPRNEVGGGGEAWFREARPSYPPPPPKISVSLKGQGNYIIMKVMYNIVVLKVKGII